MSCNVADKVDGAGVFTSAQVPGHPVEEGATDSCVAPVSGVALWGLSADIGRLLLERRAHVATAESCTGGYIAHCITAVAGSSAYFLGGVVSYANEAKSGLLEVPAGLIAREGAVSQAVVEAMAQGAKRRLGSDYAVATSGVAGPGGGTPEKPVGTVWMAVACPDGRCVSLCHHFGDRPRIEIIRAATHEALSLLKAQLL